MTLRKYLKKTLYFINKNLISQYLFSKDIKFRSSLRMTDLYKLSKRINMFAPFTNEIHQPNDWYGHAHTLKNFLNIPQSYQFKFIMEHGLYLNEQVDQIDNETNLPAFLTYSNYRKEVLKKYRKHAFSIGPFIHYAKNILSEREIKLEKKRLGNSLLFFPAHSTPIIGMEFDAKKLCKRIKSLAKYCDSIRICLYWKDILMGRDKIYRDFGFECVTAGHMLDPNFLPRLKSLISISDLTASNIISSQTGFSIHLGKPHIVIMDQLNLITTQNWKNRINEIFASKGYIEMFSEFSKPNYKITQKQRDLVKKYWGTHNIKTRGELAKIVKETENYYKE